MKVLLDTSVLVAGVVAGHPHHARALPWLKRCRRQEVRGVLAAHSLAELYAVLTRLPLQPRLSPAMAWRLVRENFLQNYEIVVLMRTDLRETLARLAELQVGGGATYDALIARAAEKARVGRLLTFNVADFRRVWPEGQEKIIQP